MIICLAHGEACILFEERIVALRVFLRPCFGFLFRRAITSVMFLEVAEAAHGVPQMIALLANVLRAEHEVATHHCRQFLNDAQPVIPHSRLRQRECVVQHLPLTTRALAREICR